MLGVQNKRNSLFRRLLADASTTKYGDETKQQAATVGARLLTSVGTSARGHATSRVVALNLTARTKRDHWVVSTGR